MYLDVLGHVAMTFEFLAGLGMPLLVCVWAGSGKVVLKMLHEL